jgi:SAM-dependent methyltransferase
MSSNYDNSGSSRQFGKQWDLFHTIDPQHEKQFNGWISAASSEFFNRKIILDAGCGNGRNSYWAATHNPNKIISIDLDELSINAARENTKDSEAVIVEARSIYQVGVDYPNYFDSVMCIGVLHHLASPHLALQSFHRSLKADGRLLLWVYGRRGNGIIYPIIQLFRFVTRHLPFKLNYYISFPIALTYRFMIKVNLIQNEYGENSKILTLKQLHNIVLDQLIPNIANYWREDEVLELIRKADFEVESIKLVNGNSWSVLARKSITKQGAPAKL